MKKILGITGIRSEYDIMYSVYKALDAHPELDLSLVVTGAHLSKNFGLTIEQIKKDGFEIADVVENLFDGDRDSSRLKGAAIQLYGLAQAVDRIRPDILLVFGDREESITTALVGAYLNIAVAHISGGDRVVGNVDDQVRHAVTKLSHIHFTTSEASKERIIKLGEQPFRVFNTGHPGLDRLASVEKMEKRELLSRFEFDEESHAKPLLLVIQHSISTEISDSYRQMKMTMEVIRRLEFNTIISYPNSDAGTRDIIRCIQEYVDLPFVRIRKNIPRLDFVNTMRYADCMVGNSSSGLMEAPFLKLPVVNIGNRQKERLHVENVQFVPHDAGKIEEAIKRACFDEEYREKVASCTNPFGDGNSGENISQILADLTIDEKLLIKDITY